MNEGFQPKAFISYSRTSPEHTEAVVGLADKLLASGVDVIVDEYDLELGHDLYDFMEKAVKDPTVTHVLMICDRVYSEKADGRLGGVGAESQIITPELYGQVSQTKFIPIILEVDENGQPYRPTFLKSRYYADFSTPDLMAENWDDLIAHVYSKPRRIKPTLGEPPPHIRDPSIAASPAAAKLAFYKTAVLNGRPHLSKHREAFFDACLISIDELRPRDKPEVNDTKLWVTERYKSLVPLRNALVDWLAFDVDVLERDALHEQLHEVLERLIEMRLVPDDFKRPFESWLAHPFEALLYEVFLYWIAVLLKTNHAATARHLYTTTVFARQDQYSKRYPYGFQDFEDQCCDLVQAHATRTDVRLADLVQVDFISFLISLLESGPRWHAHLQRFHKQHQSFPVFEKATYKRHFKKLAPVFGVESGDEFRAKMREAIAQHQNSGLWLRMRLLPDYIHLDHLDRLQ